MGVQSGTCTCTGSRLVVVVNVVVDFVVVVVQDSNGRRVFINHVHRTTSLRHPRRQERRPAPTGLSRPTLPRREGVDVRGNGWWGGRKEGGREGGMEGIADLL